MSQRTRTWIAPSRLAEATARAVGWWRRTNPARTRRARARAFMKRLEAGTTGQSETASTALTQ